MNTLNATYTNQIYGHHRPLISSLNCHRSSSSRPFFSVSPRKPTSRFAPLSFSPIRASSFSSPTLKLQIANRRCQQIPKLAETPQQNSIIQFLAPMKTTLITTITATALFLSRFYFVPKPAIGAPFSPPASVETAENEAVTDEERERTLEEHVVSNPYDIDGLKNLMEVKIKSKKIGEAIGILDKLIEIEPEESEWPLLKAHLYAYDGDVESAKVGFNELLKKDPLRVEAYHGLVTAASQEELSQDLVEIEKKVEEAIKLCRKENKKSDLRDFKLLLAQIKVIEGQYEEALKVYQDLVKEEPRDFRPYLCQGIIYTLLRRSVEAEKNFEKYRRLVPQGHPYARYFDDNMIATKIFAQKMENERAAAKS